MTNSIDWRRAARPLGSALLGALAVLGGADASHGAHWLPLATGALVPLMLPRAGASVRRALSDDGRAPGRRRGAPPHEPAATERATSLRSDAQATLLETHAAVCRELCALKTAYGELMTKFVKRDAVAGRLDHLAHHDLLTGLPNRILLMDRLTQALTYAKRASTDVLVIYLDLDRFKAINDTMGHAAGDRVIAEVGTRLAGCMRGADTASRVGGDEFILVCSAADGIADAPHVAARILAAVSAPMNVFGTTVELGASIGISLAPADGIDAAELIAKADAAMYCVKQRGRNGFNLYTPEIQADIERKSRFESELREALERDQFEVHYQPIVDLRSGQITGAEALVRWRHPVRGLLAPLEFMPFAQERGLAAEIGERVLRDVCGQLKRFALDTDDEFRISLNVSAEQLQRADFVDSIAAALAAGATDGRRLSIEFAQPSATGAASALTATLRGLRALGVALAIDDVGTGSSSLAQMRDFPVNALKIDCSFIEGIAANATDEAIAKTIITLAHGLGMGVIAEGVETPEQAQKLRTLGSDCLQGFLISRPLPAADFERFACTYGSLRLAA